MLLISHLAVFWLAFSTKMHCV